MEDLSRTSSGTSHLSHLLGGARSRSKNSIDATSASVHEKDRKRLRASLDTVVAKLKDHSAGDEHGEPTGIKKLLSKAKRRGSILADGGRTAREEVARGRHVAERGTLSEDGPPPLTFHHDDLGSKSSLLTYGSGTGSDEDEDEDEDSEGPGSKPSLSTHPSHIGYLTTSSPLINPSSTSASAPAFPEGQLDGSFRSSTRSSGAVAASESAPDLAIQDTLRPPTTGSSKRSLSPAGRLKEVFRHRRASSASTSPDRKAAGTRKAGQDHTAGEGRVQAKLSSALDDGRSSRSAANSVLSSPEKSRVASIQPISIDTKIPSQTPPSELHLAVPPTITNTPPTPVDHTTDTPAPARPASSDANVVTSPSGNMISHRRIRSSSASLGPSKLSNITSTPITPIPENGVSSPSQGGFFSNVFSAAQNAATTLSNSIQNTSVAPGAGKGRSSSNQEQKEIDSPVVETLADQTGHFMEEKELAVKTLGEGDLSLSALGISDTAGTVEQDRGEATPVAPRFAEVSRGRSETMNSEEPGRAAAAGHAIAESTDNGIGVPVEDQRTLVNPRSTHDSLPAEQTTTPNGSVFEGQSGVQRSGSIRGALHRKRGSSAATTGTTIGAAIIAANSSLAQVSSHGGTPKITGFAVASKKRNRDFHNLFRSVPEDDYLIEDYSCALQREILAHGRLYVSEGHLCFSSNIFGWVTTLVMSFDEIVSVEKRSTALLFKNGLMISTLHAKNIFASFTSRDSTYDLIVGIWKLGHPSLRSSLNGVRIDDTGGGDKTEKDDGAPVAASNQSLSDSSDESEGDDVYDEDDEREDGSFTHADGSVAGSDIAEKTISRQPSGAFVLDGTTQSKVVEDSHGSGGDDFPGPGTHEPTDCTDGDTHYPRILCDVVIPAPLGKVYGLMFGQASITWMRNWLTMEQKCLELSLDEKSKPLGLDNKVRHYSYIKPLNGAIGPRSTKCISTETLDALDFEKSASITISTQTPDVPSGNVFSTKTRYCMSWAEGNATRLQVNCNIEWTGKSWLKGPIEKGANDGQVQYTKDILVALNKAVSRRGPTAAATTPGRKGKKGGRKRARDQNAMVDGASDSKPEAENWGLFEPVHGLLGPVVDILKPILAGNVVYGLLVGLLVASFFGFGISPRSNQNAGLGFLGTPDRIAAYEEMWRREESELWGWLEERAGMDSLREVNRMPLERMGIREGLRGEGMHEREVADAIRVTEEKLRVLKGVVEKGKEGRAGY